MLVNLTGMRWVQRVGEVVNFGDFYANYIISDGSNVLANLTVLVIFMQMTSLEMGVTCW